MYLPYLFTIPLVAGALSACWAADFSASLGVSLSSPAYSCTLGYHLSWSWQLQSQIGKRSWACEKGFPEFRRREKGKELSSSKSWPSMQFRRTMDWYLHSNSATKPFFCGFDLKLQAPGEWLSHPTMAIPPPLGTVNHGAWWTMALQRSHCLFPNFVVEYKISFLVTGRSQYLEASKQAKNCWWFRCYIRLSCFNAISQSKHAIVRMTNIDDANVIPCVASGKTGSAASWHPCHHLPFSSFQAYQTPMDLQKKQGGMSTCHRPNQSKLSV